MTSNATNWKKTVIILVLAVLIWMSIQLVNPVYAEFETPAPSDLILVKFTPETTEAEREETARMMGGHITRWIDALSTAQIQLAENWADARTGTNPFVIASKNAHVASVEFDGMVSGVPVEYDQPVNLSRMKNSTIPATPVAVNDADYNNPSRQVYAPNVINLRMAWNYTMGSANVKIAILDSGIQASHPEFAGRILPGYDFVNNDNDPADDYGHGTHVAGIAAAGANNWIGMLGVCPLCSIIPVKVLNASNQGTWTNVTAGIVYAVDQGANVISLSLGGTSTTQALEDAVRYAKSKNVLVVAAVGNNRSNVPFYPAALDDVVGVAATRDDDTRWSLSNYGYFVELSAPGYAIYSTYNDLNNAYSGYNYMSGTSMAAPHVAGLAGLLFSQNPSITVARVRELMRSTAVDLGDPGRDDYFGYGRIDAFAALQAGAPPVQPDAATSGTVWQDDNVNGVWDQSERTTAEALTVQIRDTNGNVVASANANGLGQWRIANLYPGSYTIVGLALGNTRLTTQSSYSIQLTSGQEVTGLNYGIVQQDPNATVYQIFVPTVKRSQ